MLGSPTITVKGRNLLAKIVATKIPLTLSYIGLGDGLQEETEEVISLVNEIMKEEIESCKYNEKEGQYYIRRVFTNAELEEGFYIREVGIYAIDPDEGEILYAYTNAGETGVDYFAPGKGKVIVKEIIEMATKFGNAENITVVIDPSTALVTEKEFEEYKKSNENNINNLQAQIDEHKEEYTELKEDVEQLSNPNLLINGDFQVWQRGTSFSCSEGIQYTADRWAMWTMKSPTISKSPDGGYSLKWLGAGNDNLIQMVELSTSAISRDMTLSFLLKAPIGVIVKVRVDNSTVLNGSDKTQEVGKDFSGTGEWTKFVLSIPSTIVTGSVLGVRFLMGAAGDGQTVSLARVKLELGSKATPFYPRSYGEELQLCKRYYEVSSEDVIIPGMKGTVSNSYEAEYKYNVEKRIVPTLTYGNGSTGNKFALFTVGIGGTLFDVTTGNLGTKRARFYVSQTDSNSIGTPCVMTGYVRADAEIY